MHLSLEIILEIAERQGEGNNAVAAMASNVSNRLATGARFAHRHPMTAAATGLGAAIASKARNSMYPPVNTT